MELSLNPEDVAYAGVIGQLTLMRAGRLTAVELLEACLTRIELLDGRLNAFRTVFTEQALTAARAADAARAAGDERPLLGVPVAVKDNVAIAGHAPSYGTGSSEPRALADAEQVRRLRAAGAIIVGATHLPELALWPFTESPTWGQTRNPWDARYTSGGSSGGSATAVAAGLVAAATASDGGGSIRIPAAACGLVGLKPQRGRVPLGADEHWYGLSCAGILTRTVADSALVLSVLTDGQLSTELVAPSSLRIGWSIKAPTRTSVHPTVHAGLQDMLAAMRELGHHVEHVDPTYPGVVPSFLFRYVRGAHQDLQMLADPSATERRTRMVAGVGALVGDRGLGYARRAGDRAAERLATLPGGVDVLVTPTLAGPTAQVGALTGFKALFGAGRVAPFTPAWNVTGQPALSLPAGLAAGLPLAVQLIGRPGSEQLLLGLAAELEAATGFPARRPRLTGPPH